MNPLREWSRKPRHRLTFRDWMPPSGSLFLPWYGGFMLFGGGSEAAFQGGTPWYWPALAIFSGLLLLSFIVFHIRRPVISQRRGSS